MINDDRGIAIGATCWMCLFPSIKSLGASRSRPGVCPRRSDAHQDSGRHRPRLQTFKRCSRKVNVSRICIMPGSQP